MKKLNKYKCPHCNKILERESVKKWIESYCEEADKNVKLQKITKKNEKMKMKESKLVTALLFGAVTIIISIFTWVMIIILNPELGKEIAKIINL